MRRQLTTTGLGALTLGARGAARAARAASQPLQRASAPARAVIDSPLGSPVRAAVGVLRETGEQAEPQLRQWLDARARALTAAVAASPLLGVAIDAAAANPDVERAVTALLDDPRIERLLDAAMRDPRVRGLIAAIVADQGVIDGLEGLAADPRTLDLVRQIGADPRIELLVREALQSPRIDAWLRELGGDAQTLDRLAPLADSPLVLELTDRILASEEMDRVLRTVAASPEIRMAVAEQSMGVAGEITTGVRDRSVTLDDLVEQRVRSWLRRDRGRRNGSATDEPGERS